MQYDRNPTNQTQEIEKPELKLFSFPSQSSDSIWRMKGRDMENLTFLEKGEDSENQNIFSIAFYISEIWAFEYTLFLVFTVYNSRPRFFSDTNIVGQF